MGRDSFILLSDPINLPLEKPMCPSAEAWIPPFPSPPERADVAGRPSPRRSPQAAGRTLAHVSSCPRERRACRSGRPPARGAGDRAKAGRSAFFGLGFLKTTLAIRIHFVLVSVRPIWVRFCETIPSIYSRTFLVPAVADHMRRVALTSYSSPGSQGRARQHFI